MSKHHRLDHCILIETLTLTLSISHFENDGVNVLGQKLSVKLRQFQQLRIYVGFAVCSLIFFPSSAWQNSPKLEDQCNSFSPMTN